jgi:hypothetical protein
MYFLTGVSVAREARYVEEHAVARRARHRYRDVGHVFGIRGVSTPLNHNALEFAVLAEVCLLNPVLPRSEVVVKVRYTVGAASELLVGIRHPCGVGLQEAAAIPRALLIQNGAHPEWAAQ